MLQHRLSSRRNAGTHNPRKGFCAKALATFVLSDRSRGMGPGVRRDDVN